MVMTTGIIIIMIDAQTLLKLQTWFSPAFPIGAFSYSHGLEAAIEAGDVFDRTGDFDSLYVAFSIAGIAAALAAWLLPKSPQTGRRAPTQAAVAE